MEPVSLTLGAVVAAMVAKAVGKAEDQAVEEGAGALRRMVGWLRERFTGGGDEVGARALSRVEDAPDSPSRTRELAEVLDQRSDADAEFRAALERLVTEARVEGVDVGSITQTAWGNQNVQTSGVANSEINVTFGQPSHPKPSEP